MRSPMRHRILWLLGLVGCVLLPPTLSECSEGGWFWNRRKCRPSSCEPCPTVCQRRVVLCEPCPVICESVRKKHFDCGFCTWEFDATMLAGQQWVFKKSTCKSKFGCPKVGDKECQSDKVNPNKFKYIPKPLKKKGKYLKLKISCDLAARYQEKEARDVDCGGAYCVFFWDESSGSWIRDTTQGGCDDPTVCMCPNPADEFKDVFSKPIRLIDGEKEDVTVLSMCDPI